MSTKKNVATETATAKEATKKNVAFTQEELNNIMKALDKDVFVRLTTNDDLAVEIFDTASPNTRCGLWQRGKHGKRYDLYIGNATKYSEKAKTLNSVDYTTDKKMSKKEVAFLKLSQTEVIELINTLASTESAQTEQKATKKATTTKKTTKKASKTA